MNRAGGAVIALLFLGPALPAAERMPAPSDGVAWAARDLAALQVKAKSKSAKQFATIRYLWLGMEPAEDRIADWKIASLQMNMLSRRAARTRLYVVPDTNWSLLRLDLEDYGIRPEIWDLMGIYDPVFFFPVNKEEVVYIEKQVPRKGNKKKKRPLLVPKRIPVKSVKRYQTVAPWLAPTGQSPLGKVEHINLFGSIQTTTNSAAPIVSLSWFFYQTATAENRDDEHPGYYQFLGIRTQKDFERIIGHHDDRKRGFMEYLAAVKNSGVARQPRRVRRDRGRYWRTFDNTIAVDRFLRVKGKDVIERRNPLRTLNDEVEVFRFDATEAYGPLPNDLWVMGLWNEGGELQTFVPGLVGHDRLSRTNNGRIQVPASCMRCHRYGGLQDVNCFVRQTISTRGNIQDLGLQSPDKYLAGLLRDQYQRSLDVPLASDRRWYELALWELTEWKPARAAALYGRSWTDWAERPVSLLRASQEMGCSVELLRDRLQKYARATGGVDTVLAALFDPDVTRANIPRDQWGEVYALCQFVVGGSVPLDFSYPAGYRHGSFLKKRAYKTKPFKSILHHDGGER